MQPLVKAKRLHVHLLWNGNVEIRRTGRQQQKILREKFIGRRGLQKKNGGTQWDNSTCLCVWKIQDKQPTAVNFCSHNMWSNHHGSLTTFIKTWLFRKQHKFNLRYFQYKIKLTITVVFERFPLKWQCPGHHI